MTSKQWTHEPATKHHGHYVIDAATCRTVCDLYVKTITQIRGVPFNYHEHDDAEANARKIAAVPRLIEALKALAPAPGDPWPDIPAAQANARKLIEGLES
jgi:hypothetical protein